MDGFTGEIRMWAGSYAPRKWLFCEGQSLSVYEFDKLFEVIETTYGGDGISTFMLPDLRGRIPVHMGTVAGRDFALAEAGGAETVTLEEANLPVHAHPLMASIANATTASPRGLAAAALPEVATLAYGTDRPPTTFHPTIGGVAGEGQPHDNVQPFTCINFIILTDGFRPLP